MGNQWYEPNKLVREDWEAWCDEPEQSEVRDLALQYPSWRLFYLGDTDLRVYPAGIQRGGERVLVELSAAFNETDQPPAIIPVRPEHLRPCEDVALREGFGLLD